MLRDYQRQALTALREARGASPDVNRLAIEMATGLGKTITFAAELDEWLDNGFDSAGCRALVLVHTDELVRQAVDRILFVTKGRWTVGVVKAGQNDVYADIIVASVQTLAQPGRKEQIKDVGKIIVDEAHHAVAASYTQILRYFNALCACLPYEAGGDGPERDCPEHGDGTVSTVPVTGYSATMSRTDGKGLGHVFQDLAFSRSLSWGIRHGYLIDFVPYTITVPGVEPGPDAVLDNALATSLAPEAVIQAWLEKTTQVDLDLDNAAMYRPRPSTVLFAPLVRSAQAFADAFNAAGVKAEVVAGALPDEHNRAVLARYEAGITTVVCNAMKLTEGWDSPKTMCVIVARPTQSVSLLIQMLGRGLRPWLEASAPPREDQRCVVFCIQGTVQSVASVADLSDKIGEVKEGQSFLTMEDEWDIGRELDGLNEPAGYSGPVHVQQWDAIVQASSKAWTYTEGGTPFLPTRKHEQGYVFVVDTTVWAAEYVKVLGKLHTYRMLYQKVTTAPDLELAMAAAEDEAQERGGDIGALLADKTRPWRKSVPSAEAMAEAQRLGLGKELIKIMESRASGKAGKLSDLISRVKASRVLDPNVTKIKERARA